MQQQENSTDFVSSVLPWLVTGIALLLYLLTLNHWLSVGSLPVVAQLAGWHWWTAPIEAPLLHLLTCPLLLLPAFAQPVAFNVFAAVCAAGALGLLANSVALLPHDRTREQRQRERSEFSLLSISAAWLPPVFAVLVCGLQRSFWENAVAATGESLNLLLFAYLVRCLLEYRLDPRESWLVRLAFVYGLAVTNNWAMIGFFPAVLVALLWIKGTSCFSFRFASRMVGFGCLGLLLYLFLPLIEVATAKPALSFWQTLKFEWVAQRDYLLGFPRSRLILCSLTSILPVVIMGIRWPSSLGDVSVIGAALSRLMFRLIHLLFLTVCLWVAFDPPFSPRALGFGLPFLPFYYLGALSVGYFSGYVLLVFREESAKPWRRPSGWNRLTNRVAQAAVWVALVAVSAGLLYRNLPSVQTNNGAHLEHLADTLAESLPHHSAIVMSDETLDLLLLEAGLSRHGSPDKHVLLDTRSMQYGFYQRTLLTHYHGKWPNVFGAQTLPGLISPVTLRQLISFVARSNQVYYLHPSFGYYFERFYTEPHGVVCQLHAYPPKQVVPPALTPSVLRENQVFWRQLNPTLSDLEAAVKKEASDPVQSDAEFVGRFYARALDFWGVRLQRNKHYAEAGKAFALALNLSPKNVAAQVNLEYNRTLQKGSAHTVEVTKSIEDRIRQYPTWDAVLRENGPFDEPNFCYALGAAFARNSLPRQAALEYRRAAELSPNDLTMQFSLARAYLEVNAADHALQVVHTIRALAPTHPLTATNEVDLACLEASADCMTTNYAAAQRLLLQAETRHPDDTKILDVLSQVYVLQHRYQQAVAVIDQHLRLSPDNIPVLLGKGVVLMQAGQYQDALTPLTRVLTLAPTNSEPYVAALLDRAIVNLQNNQLDASRRDYNEFLNRVPRSYRAYYGLGEIAYRKKEKAKAIEAYRNYLKYVPSPTTPEQAKERKEVSDNLKELQTPSR
jgi:tetratricopeptide (TPR) repeat protein